MTFPRLRALWLAFRGFMVQPDPTEPEPRPGDVHSRKVWWRKHPPIGLDRVNAAIDALGDDLWYPPLGEVRVSPTRGPGFILYAENDQAAALALIAMSRKVDA